MNMQHFGLSIKWRRSQRQQNQTRGLFPSTRRCENFIGNTNISLPFPQDVNYLLRNYATNENIADTEDEIAMFSEPLKLILLLYAKKFVVKTIWCADVYEEHELKEVFIKELRTSMRQSMSGYWVSRKSTNLFYISFFAIFLLNSIDIQQGSLHSQAGAKSQNRRPIWQHRGQLVDVITSSEAGSTSTWNDCGVDLVLMAIGYGSSMTPSLSTDKPTNQSSTKASKNSAHLCALLFKKCIGCMTASSTQTNRRKYSTRIVIFTWEDPVERMHIRLAHLTNPPR